VRAFRGSDDALIALSVVRLPRIGFDLISKAPKGLLLWS